MSSSTILSGDSNQLQDKHKKNSQTNNTNQQRLRSEMRAEHDRVDQYFNVYISSHPRPQQALGQFLAVMSYFWRNLFDGEFPGERELAKDLEVFDLKELKINQNSPNSMKISAISVGYLFWGSAMGSRKLQGIYQKLTGQKLQCDYFDYLINHQQTSWPVILQTLEQLSVEQLGDVITEVQNSFRWLMSLMQQHLLFSNTLSANERVSQPPN